MKENTSGWTMTRRWWPLTLPLSILLVLGCVACYGSKDAARNNSGSALNQPNQTVAASQTHTPRGEVEATKQAFLDDDQAKRDAAKTRVAENKAPMPTLPPPATPVPRDTPEPGLGTCGMGDRSFRMTSCWGGKLGNEYVYVNAGVLRNDPTQGGVQVFTTTLEGRLLGDVVTYSSPRKQGALAIAYIDLPRVILIAPQKNGSTAMIAYDLQTRQWEANAPCKVYPLAVHAGSFKGSKNRHEKNKVSIDTAGANGFRWLAFSPGTGKTNGSSALPMPGESVSYTNSEDATDHVPSVGDWLQTVDDIGTGQETRSTLDFLRTSGFIVPVPLWDKAKGQGKDLKYHISGFAWTRVAAYESFPPTHLSLEAWGTASCDGT